MFEYNPQHLKNAAKARGIHIQYGAIGDSFSFDGDESAFSRALKQLMSDLGMIPQHSDWLPGTPTGETTDYGYYVAWGDVDMMFDYSNMYLYIC